MDRLQIKKSAKQLVTSNFAKMLTPLWATLIWGVIIALLIVVAVLANIFIPITIVNIILTIIIALICIFFMLNLNLRKAEFYLLASRGEEMPELKVFFKFSGSLRKIWIMFKMSFTKIVFGLLAVFMPGYIKTLFYVDDFEVLENNDKDSKVHFVKIPRLTSPHIFELALVRLSFFWWNVLIIVTLGIAGIFVGPYKNITRAKVYAFLVESLDRDEKIKRSFMQIASEQGAVSANQVVEGKKDPAFMDADQSKFEQIKKDFVSNENELAIYIGFADTFDNILQCENNHQVLQLLQDYSGEIEYKNKKYFEKSDRKLLKNALSNYKAISSRLATIENADMKDIFDSLSKIVEDRISVLELEIMKLQPYAMSVAFGGVSKLKKYIKNSEESKRSAKFGEVCADQLPKQKKAFAVMASAMLAAFLICIVMPITIALSTAPLNKVTIGGVTYVKTGYQNSYYVDKLNNKNAKSVTIKDEVRGLPVTRIDDNAFSNCSKLESVTIPNSVTEIGERAFFNKTNLTSITIPNGVNSIGESVFEGCTSLESIIIPNGVQNIGKYAFRDCTSLKNITIPDSVTGISDQAFSCCTSLESVTIGKGVESVGEYVFSNCTSLKTATISCSIIGEYMFQNCSGLKSIIITTDYISEIGDYAFRGCTNLESATIGSVGGSAKMIGLGEFSDCSKLKNIIIADGTTRVSGSALYNWTRIESIIIPNSVVEIGSYAFYGCSSLTSMTIPNSVVEIEDWAFMNCTSLESVTIGNGVEYIGYGVFNNCSPLTTINYNGTMSEWKNIDKYYEWYNSSNISTIICTDGKLDKYDHIIE